MEISPKDKRMLDALYESTSRVEARRRLIVWNIIGASSLLLVALVFIEWLPGWLRMGSVITGGIVFFIYLAWLSTTEFGKMLADAITPTNRV